MSRKPVQRSLQAAVALFAPIALSYYYPGQHAARIDQDAAILLSYRYAKAYDCIFVNPEDGKFQGVAIVWGCNFDDALRRSRKLKISPGCQVRGKKLPKWGEPEEEFLNRLLSKEEIIENKLGLPSATERIKL